MQNSKDLGNEHPMSTAAPRYGRNFALALGGVLSVFVVSSLLYDEAGSKFAPVGVPVMSYKVFDRRQTPSANDTLPATSGSDKDFFDWSKITPSTVLNWVDCYPGTQCARLEVPLDYSDPDGDKAAVALIRVKAKVSPKSTEYHGPILFNPGGPGRSGVDFIRRQGKHFQQMLGEQYDIIGFDPRGIGETTPPVSIFPDRVERSYWEAGTPPFPNSTPDALSQGFSRALLFSGLVEDRSKRAAQYASTAIVARDMLSIMKAHGRDRLQYWGFSYGTVLGATYAAMFPDNVERLVIDGVLDFDDYYTGSWSKNLLDTDNLLKYFYDHCTSAGSACPLHANSSALVRQRVESIFAKVKANPVPAINGTEYVLVDYLVLKSLLFESLYDPFKLFPIFAIALAALEKEDGRPALAIWKALEPTVKCDTPPPPVMGQRQEAMLAVLCGEAEGVSNSLPKLADYLQNQLKISVFADVWTSAVRTPCAGWKVRAKERFAGPFTVNTSFPLLIIGNTADPVTPLVGAQKAARGFQGSVLLTVDTPGHTSFAATSMCANKIIRNYFTNGELPQAGTVCEIENVLFGAPPPIPQNMTTDDAELLKVSRSLNNEFHSSRRSRFL